MFNIATELLNTYVIWFASSCLIEFTELIKDTYLYWPKTRIYTLYLLWSFQISAGVSRHTNVVVVPKTQNVGLCETDLKLSK